MHDLGRKLKWNPPALSVVGTARASLKKFENEFSLLSGKQKLKNDQIFQFHCIGNNYVPLGAAYQL